VAVSVRGVDVRGVRSILEQEHPYYDEIKQAMPNYYCNTGKDGNPVYIERSGQTDLAKVCCECMHGLSTCRTSACARVG
jgi:hypothetical protein